MWRQTLIHLPLVIWAKNLDGRKSGTISPRLTISNVAVQCNQLQRPKYTASKPTVQGILCLQLTHSTSPSTELSWSGEITSLILLQRQWRYWTYFLRDLWGWNTNVKRRFIVFGSTFCTRDGKSMHSESDFYFCHCAFLMYSLPFLVWVSMSLHRKQNSGNSTGTIAYGVKAFSCNHRLYSMEL